MNTHVYIYILIIYVHIIFVYNLTGVDSTIIIAQPPHPLARKVASMVTIDIAWSKMGLTNERLEQ